MGSRDDNFRNYISSLNGRPFTSADLRMKFPQYAGSYSNALRKLEKFGFIEKIGTCDMNKHKNVYLYKEIGEE